MKYHLCMSGLCSAQLLGAEKRNVKRELIIIIQKTEQQTTDPPHRRGEGGFYFWFNCKLPEGSGPIPEVLQYRANP